MIICTFYSDEDEGWIAMVEHYGDQPLYQFISAFAKDQLTAIEELVKGLRLVSETVESKKEK